MSFINRTDPAIAELKSRLKSLDEICLTNLERGLGGIAAGDLTVEVHPATTPITAKARSGEVQELIDVFNSMLGRAQTALESYEVARKQLRTGLGDQSCLIELEERLTSLDEHCLTNLGAGLQAMTKGDLTVHVEPMTHALESGQGRDLGTLGTIFNSMLARAQAGLGLYNTTREQIADHHRRDLRHRRHGLDRLVADVVHGDRDEQGDRGDRPRRDRDGRGRTAADHHDRRDAAGHRGGRRPGRSGPRDGRPGRASDRADRVDRRPDQPARAERGHRGRTRRRAGPRLRGRRRGGPEAGRVRRRRPPGRRGTRSTAWPRASRA